MRYTPTSKTGARERQRGQAIPLGLVAIAVSMALVLVLFNTSQITTEKMRAANTADAAAYSGMVWQARALNFQAYINRASVANQVSIAQMVSFASWTKYFRTTARNINTIGQFIPYVNIVTRIMNQIATQMDNIMVRLVNVVVPVLDGLLTGLRIALQAVHWAAAGTTTSIVREVVRRNDPLFDITPSGLVYLARNAINYGNDFSRTYSSNSEKRRVANVMMDSRDDFSRDRGWEMRLLNLGFVRYELVKGGTTRLLNRNDTWEWKGRDTLSLHTYTRTWRGTRHTEMPIGWGAAYASQDIENCRRNCGWTANSSAEQLANAEITRLRGYGRSESGVRAYREIRNLRVTDPKLPLAIEIRKRATNIRTSSNIPGMGSSSNAQTMSGGIGVGMFRINDNLAGNEIAAVSKAEVYFKRPERRADGQSEYGNLFNPYWDARLASAATERRFAWLLKGYFLSSNIDAYR